METVWTILSRLGVTLVVLLALGLGTERGTQVIKEFLRELAKRVPWLDFRDRRSFLLAAVVSFFVTYFFGVDATEYLELLDGFDPELVRMVNALLLLFFSNQIHDRFGVDTSQSG